MSAVRLEIVHIAADMHVGKVEREIKLPDISLIMSSTACDIREFKHVGRQRDDDGQNKFLQINDNKENLSYIIIRMNLIQCKKLKTLALCLGRVLLNRILSCTCYVVILSCTGVV
jgi:hypothetical protein